MSTPETAVQNKNFQSPGFIDICEVGECATEITNPEQLQTVIWEKLVSTGAGKDRKFVPQRIYEELKENRIFVLGRNAALGHKLLGHVENNQRLLDAIPSRLADASRACAACILANTCPKYYSANGSVRMRPRGLPQSDAGQQRETEV